jgi:hypothetical protein
MDHHLSSDVDALPVGAPCAQEAAVLAAAAAGVWEEPLRAHARTCSACQDALEVWRYLQIEAEQVADALDDDPIPHAGVIWWRRRILDERAAAQRLLWPVTVFPLVAGAIALAALIAVALWQWHAIAIGAAGPVSSSSSSAAGIDVRILTLLLLLAATVPIAWSIVSALYLWHRK